MLYFPLILVPCILYSFGILYSFDILPELANISLFVSPLVLINKSDEELTSKSRKMTDEEFAQWFSGFVDAEGCFSIESSGVNGVRFRFFINLHIDDREVLEFIQSKLKCGNIKIHKDYVRYSLNTIEEINNNLIPLLESFPLNDVKYLDFLAFKEGINIKLSNSLNPEKLKLIFDLKDSMNSGRNNYEMPSSHAIRITPYWLLGLMEGVKKKKPEKNKY